MLGVRPWMLDVSVSSAAGKNRPSVRCFFAAGNGTDGTASSLHWLKQNRSGIVSVVPMSRCAFLTLNDSTGFVIDDELAYPYLAALGWSVEAISWRTPSCDWRACDAVVIR